MDKVGCSCSLDCLRHTNVLYVYTDTHTCSHRAEEMHLRLKDLAQKLILCNFTYINMKTCILPLFILSKSSRSYFLCSTLWSVDGALVPLRGNSTCFDVFICHVWVFCN